MWPFRKLWAALHTAEQIRACRGGKENPGRAAPIIKNPTYVWEGSDSSTEQCVQQKSAREEDGNTGGKETPGLCRSTPAILLCTKGILDTACFQQRWVLPLLEKVLWPCLKHQSKGPYGGCIWGWRVRSCGVAHNFSVCTLFFFSC